MGRASVGSRVTVALFADPLEFDLTIDPLSATDKYGPEVGWVFFDRTDGRIGAARAAAASAQRVHSGRAHDIVTDFWLRAPRMRRWVAQADLHRAGKELQCARNWLVELMLIANEPDKLHELQKDTFILLSPYQWEELKTTYTLVEFTPQSVARAMIRLVDAISFWGRAACARQRSEYPVELENVSMSAVSEFYEATFGPLSGRDNGRGPR
jgi:hypothetical protein